MTRDEIIRMAREAGLCTWVVPPQGAVKQLKRFAALVAAAEREECAEIAMAVGTNTEPTDFALDRCYEIADKIRGRK